MRIAIIVAAMMLLASCIPSGGKRETPAPTRRPATTSVATDPVIRQCLPISRQKKSLPPACDQRFTRAAARLAVSSYSISVLRLPISAR